MGLELDSRCAANAPLQSPTATAPPVGEPRLAAPSGGSPAKRARGCICVEDADQLNAQGSKLKAMTLTAIMLNRKFPTARQTAIGELQIF